ncbi:protein of unknown function [Hyphomicrobium sp. 1Nfss2.1]|uniref:hypothetical protein n=1 Tax=Hyphomicrobium sp. 1Nfss2.1 TaxID=3413936 RepID=UPI003C7A6E42
MSNNELTGAQASALRRIVQSKGGLDSYCFIHPLNGGTCEKIDVRTVVSLVARGLLAGSGGRIRPTKAGRVCAAILQATAHQG